MIEARIRKLYRAGRLDPLIGVLRRLGLLTPAFRVYEKLTALKGSGGDRAVADADGDGPLPPPELIVLVAGTPDSAWFLGVGKVVFQTIVRLLALHGAPVERMGAILEFGCGCGRVLRHWRGVTGPAIHGTDYNPRLIGWCRENLPFVRAGINKLRPPLSYADGSFDLVYAISVFTHLSEELQDAWMREMARIIRPGGHLIITTHGESYRESLSPAERAGFDAGRLVVRYEETSGTNLCSAYHPREYVRQRLGAGFSAEDFIAAGTVPELYQDLHLLRRNAA